MNTKKNSFLVVAAVLFILYSIFGFANLLINISGWAARGIIAYSLLPAAFLLFAIGLLTSNRTICIIGASVELLNYFFLQIYRFRLFNFLFWVTLAIVLLMIAVVVKNWASIPLAIISALALVLHSFFTTTFIFTPQSLAEFIADKGFGAFITVTFLGPFRQLSFLISSYRYNDKLFMIVQFLNNRFFPAIILPIASVLMGIGVTKITSAEPITLGNQTPEIIDRLIMLKQLLDDGKITRKEYDTKKSQALSTLGLSTTLPMPIPANGWQCKNCGKSHYDYETSCSCGISRFDNKKTVEQVIDPEIIDLKTPASTSELATIELPLVADEIRKFKDLADKGIITQEEFEAKKKQLLDL